MLYDCYAYTSPDDNITYEYEYAGVVGTYKSKTRRELINELSSLSLVQ